MNYINSEFLTALNTLEMVYGRSWPSTMTEQEKAESTAYKVVMSLNKRIAEANTTHVTVDFANRCMRDRMRILDEVERDHPTWSVEQVCRYLGIDEVQYKTYTNINNRKKYYRYLIYKNGEFISGHFNRKGISDKYLGYDERNYTRLKETIQGMGYTIITR